MEEVVKLYEWPLSNSSPGVHDNLLWGGEGAGDPGKIH